MATKTKTADKPTLNEKYSPAEKKKIQTLFLNPNMLICRAY